MGKLWDALKKAEREGHSDYVSEYEQTFEAPPEDYAGDYDLNLTSNMSEEYRKLFHVIKRIGEEQRKDLRLVLVTAAGFGEGVTTVAVSLAANLASDKRDSKVLLLDLNLRNPDVHRIFDFMPAPGIVDAVLDYEKRMEYFRASPLRLVPNLHLMTAGNTDLIQTNPSEILEHENLGKFLKELKGFYKTVIIDCAPIFPFSDAVSLAPIIDGTILVIDAQTTRWEVAAKARDHLMFADANVLGVVLNKRKLVIPKAIYRRL
ncbi:MAG TPA: CpsD/CapB family tyrosine-protein kinase [Acidobacteriota bacterium]|nr:CpsD/CapB family tyrosine-protein kinase [Acidobacteriota bacterium]